MFFADIEDVAQGIESRQEDALKFGDFSSFHVDSVEVMVMRGDGRFFCSELTRPANCL
jgi:hypothetical protein